MHRNSVIIIPNKSVPVAARLDHMNATLVEIQGKVSKLARLAELLVETEELTVRTHASRFRPHVNAKPALMLVPKNEKHAACA